MTDLVPKHRATPARIPTAVARKRPAPVRPLHATGRVIPRAPVASPSLSQRMAAFDKRHPIAGPCLKALAWALSCLLVVALLVAGLIVWIAHTVTLAQVEAAGGALFGLAVLAFLLTRSGGGDGHSGYGFHWTKCK
jgi:hypothetical protein